MSATPPGYIHGTAASEQARLRDLNRHTNTGFIQVLDVPAGGRVLEIGSGLGMLAAAVADAAPGASVVGVEIAPAQIAAAVRHAAVRYVRADALALPCADETFDLVYARFVLEHVPDPARLLQEARRVLRRGGRMAVMENDISLVRFDPPCPVFARVWDAFARLQIDLGGDPFVGRRLYRLLRDAGFEGVVLSVQPEVHWHGSAGWTWWVENIIGNVESAREALATRGYAAAAEIDAAVAELRALTGRPDGSATFVWNRAVCYRDGRS